MPHLGIVLRFDRVTLSYQLIAGVILDITAAVSDNEILRCGDLKRVERGLTEAELGSDSAKASESV